jgi:hypothetical protein
VIAILRKPKKLKSKKNYLKTVEPTALSHPSEK